MGAVMPPRPPRMLSEEEREQMRKARAAGKVVYEPAVFSSPGLAQQDVLEYGKSVRGIHPGRSACWRTGYRGQPGRRLLHDGDRPPFRHAQGEDASVFDQIRNHFRSRPSRLPGTLPHAPPPALAKPPESCATQTNSRRP